MPSNKLEIRSTKHEVRALGDGHIVGYASMFNTPYQVGWFIEKVAPTAFDRCLSSNPDVRCLFNHDNNYPLGRTLANTLSLKADGVGLRYDCTPPKTSMGESVVEAILRGDISNSSFQFTVKQDTWNDAYDDAGKIKASIRTILDADLLDVSPVTFPASTATTVAIRSLWPQGMPSEVRSRRTKSNDTCDCDCPECEDGDCPECTNPDCDDINCRCNDGRAKSPARLVAENERQRMMARLRVIQASL